VNPCGLIDLLLLSQTKGKGRVE
jgi:hypothetical protein